MESGKRMNAKHLNYAFVVRKVENSFSRRRNTMVKSFHLNILAIPHSHYWYFDSLYKTEALWGDRSRNAFVRLIQLQRPPKKPITDCTPTLAFAWCQCQSNLNKHSFYWHYGLSKETRREKSQFSIS